MVVRLQYIYFHCIDGFSFVFFTSSAFLNITMFYIDVILSLCPLFLSESLITYLSAGVIGLV